MPPSPWLWPWVLALTTYGAALVALLWPQPKPKRPVPRVPGQRRPADDTTTVPR